MGIFAHFWLAPSSQEALLPESRCLRRAKRASAFRKRGPCEPLASYKCSPRTPRSALSEELTPPEIRESPRPPAPAGLAAVAENYSPFHRFRPKPKTPPHYGVSQAGGLVETSSRIPTRPFPAFLKKRAMGLTTSQPPAPWPSFKEKSARAR